MTAEEFAQNVSRTGILSAEELVLFYDNFSGMDICSDVWNISERRLKSKELLRCCRFSNYTKNSLSYILKTKVVSVEQSLGVSFSKPVKIHGVCLLVWPGQSYDVKLEVLSQKIEKKGALWFTQSKFDVMFAVPVNVPAHFIVHLKVNVTGNANNDTGVSMKNPVKVNDIIVNFFNLNDADSCDSHTPVTRDQIYEIIFSET